MLNGKMQHSLLPFADVIINMPLMFEMKGLQGALIHLQSVKQLLF